MQKMPKEYHKVKRKYKWVEKVNSTVWCTFTLCTASHISLVPCTHIHTTCILHVFAWSHFAFTGTSLPLPFTPSTPLPHPLSQHRLPMHFAILFAQRTIGRDHNPPFNAPGTAKSMFTGQDDQFFAGREIRQTDGTRGPTNFPFRAQNSIGARKQTT